MNFIYRISHSFVYILLSFLCSYVCAGSLNTIDAFEVQKLYTVWHGLDKPTCVYEQRIIDELLGDGESTMRIVKAADTLGWNVITAEKAKLLTRNQLKNSFGLFIKTWKDFSSQDYFPIYIPLVRVDFLFEEAKNANSIKQSLEHVCDAYDLSIRGIANCGYYPWDYILEKPIKNIRFFSAWYPTVPANVYTSTGPNILMYCGAAWCQQQSDKKGRYWNLWNQLDEQDYFKVYGLETTWTGLKSYGGFIPADGKRFVDTANKHGMMLVLHSKIHTDLGAPSGRIFEAAAAAALIISDRHPFVVREFGDTVLYIDVSREDLFEQVDAHVQWARAHPEQAKAMAHTAHTLFLEKFTLEQQLLHLYQRLEDSDSLNPSVFSCYKNYYLDRYLHAYHNFITYVKTYLYKNPWIQACRLYCKKRLKSSH